MALINACLWFDGQAEEAARFYSTLFPIGKVGTIVRYDEAVAQAIGQKAASAMTVEFTMENLKILALNGGPQFKFTPSLSFYVGCDSQAEIDALWQKLAQDGKVRMELGAFPWAERYGWVADRYGVEWQLIQAPHEQKITVAFLFVNDLFGKGEAAVKSYTDLFPNSKVKTMFRDEAAGTLAYCSFTLDGQDFVLMEGGGKHDYGFTEAFSLVVNCKDQEEIDYYWEKLSAGGSKSQCGWLKDRFGVAWQVVPAVLQDMMKDPKKAGRVMQEIMPMTKIDLQRLELAYSRK